ncbi:putative peptidase [bioreactor metagenome]|uniref:Putative peptidase n=1 Tax=bioreactor metagenome TaxID=1076179 RepID=A0A645DNT9_9ZZZZ
MIYDRENLIYFAGVDDLEGGALAVPAEGEAELFCLWMEADHIRETSGIEKVTPYFFPKDNQSGMMGKWLSAQGWPAPRLGFTRYFISLKDYQCLRDAAPDMVVGDIAALCYELRSVKCPAELRRIRMASQALAAGMEAAVAAAAPGLTETAVLAEAEYAMGKAGSQGSSFRMQVLTHSRQMHKHPYASSAKLENNAPVVIHLGATVEGYASKMCRTVFLGQPQQESVRIYEVLRQAQEVSLANLKPGITCAQLYDAVTEYIASTEFARYWVMHHIGYGVGIRQSEFYPIIAKDNPIVIQENMVVDLLLPSLYKPGIGGPRITDTILVTANGPEYLTNYARDVLIKA